MSELEHPDHGRRTGCQLAHRARDAGLAELHPVARPGLLALLDNELQAEHGLSLGDYEVLRPPLRGARAGDPDERARRPAAPVAERDHPPDRRSREGAVWSSAGRARAIAAARTRCSPTLGLKTLRNAAPTHVRGVREHFVDRLDREPARASSRPRCPRSTSTSSAPPAAATRWSRARRAGASARRGRRAPVVRGGGAIRARPRRRWRATRSRSPRAVAVSAARR